MKSVKNLLIVGHIGLLIAIFLTCIQIVAFDVSFYEKEYEKLAVDQTIGTSLEELEVVTATFLDYLSDKRDDLNVEIMIDGYYQPFFNQKEIDHMVDVKLLYLNAMMVRNILLVGGILIMFFSFKRNKNLYWQSFKIAIIGLGLIVGFLILFALIDFNTFWTTFHLMFFSNDLWILNPAVDRLIMLVPLEFFYDMVFKIVFYTLIGYALYITTNYFVGRKYEN